LNQARVVSTGISFDQNGRATNGILDMIVPEPDAMVRLINDLRDMTEVNPPNYPSSAAPDAKFQQSGGPAAGSSSSAEVRCFVALSNSPSNRKLIKINPSMSMEQLFAEIGSKFQCGLVKFRLELLIDGQDRVDIDSPSDISANDTIIATPFW
jgi:hypothetical protein